MNTYIRLSNFNCYLPKEPTIPAIDNVLLGTKYAMHNLNTYGTDWLQTQ